MPDSAGELWWVADGRAEGPPLVLVPDAHRPASVWPPALVDGLVAGGWRVARLDLRDQGRSPHHDGDGALGLDDLVADVAATLATIGPAHLVGHGLGATVALSLALGSAELVTRLTVVGGTGWLVDPTLPGPDEPTAVGLVWRRRLGAGDGQVGLVTALAREERLLAGPDDPGPAVAAGEVRRWLEHGFNPADGHRAIWLTAPSRWTELAAVGERFPPLTVVHGRSDPLVPVAHGRRLASSVAGAELVEVDGVGHALTPRLVASLLAAIGPAPTDRRP